MFLKRTTLTGGSCVEGTRAERLHGRSRPASWSEGRSDCLAAITHVIGVKLWSNGFCDWI